MYIRTIDSVRKTQAPGLKIPGEKRMMLMMDAIEQSVHLIV